MLYVYSVDVTAMFSVVFALVAAFRAFEWKSSRNQADINFSSQNQADNDFLGYILPTSCCYSKEPTLFLLEKRACLKLQCSIAILTYSF